MAFLVSFFAVTDCKMLLGESDCPSNHWTSLQGQKETTALAVTQQMARYAASLLTDHMPATLLYVICATGLSSFKTTNIQEKEVLTIVACFLTNCKDA